MQQNSFKSHFCLIRRQMETNFDLRNLRKKCKFINSLIGRQHTLRLTRKICLKSAQLEILQPPLTRNQASLIRQLIWREVTGRLSQCLRCHHPLFYSLLMRRGMVLNCYSFANINLLALKGFFFFNFYYVFFLFVIIMGCIVFVILVLMLFILFHFVILFMICFLLFFLFQWQFIMNGNLLRSQGLLAVAVGAGVVLGAAGVFLYEHLFKEKRRLILQNDVTKLGVSVSELRSELQEIR